MSIQYVEHPAEKYVEVVIDGGVSKVDMDALFPKLEAFMEAQGEIGVMEVIHGLGFVNVMAALPHLGTGLQALGKVRRVALVTDLSPLAELTKAGAAVSPIRTRVFSRREEAAARAWLAEASG